MPVSAVYILDSKGKPLIWRNYRGDVPNNVPDRFFKYIDNEEEISVKPVFQLDGISYAFIKHSNVYFVAVTKVNANIGLMMMFLLRLIALLKDYFGEVDEESVRDNFVIIYELLDEIMDFGLPQITDGKVLQLYIHTKSHKVENELAPRPPPAVTGAVSWRPEGIKHKKNEVFLDVVERVNMLMSPTGAVLHSEIAGTVEMRSRLSGMPELKLGLNDKVLFESQGRAAKGRTVDLEDVKFHQCVRLARFDTDRTISFIPPDGEFELMSYRLNTRVRPLFQIETKIEKFAHSRVEVFVKAKAQFKERSSANNVQIIVPVPADVSAPTFRCSTGKAAYAPEQDAVIWSIKQFGGGKEFTMRAHFSLPSIVREELRRPPLRIQFEIPYFTVSGIQVRYLKIIERSGYTALPWVRYITRSGDYQMRMA